MVLQIVRATDGPKRHTLLTPRKAKACLAQNHVIFELLQFDSTLNLAWALLGTIALVRTLCVSRRVARHSSRRRQLLEAVGVASIIIALFPFISATDDVLRIEQIKSQHEQGQSPGGHHNNLLRLFETADHSVVTRCAPVRLTLVFLELVVVLFISQVSHTAPLIAGRSPPSLAQA